MLNFHTLGLCEGRHNLPVDGYIFPSTLNPVDIEGMEKMAVERLKELFPNVHTAYWGYPNRLKKDDIWVQFRGRLDLYVTGLTAALIAVINACLKLGIVVMLWHYDKATGEYYSQPVKFHD